MSGIILWHDLDLDDDEDKDESLYDEDLDTDFEEDENFDLFEVKCKNCGAIIDDVYCEVCGWFAGV